MLDAVQRWTNPIISFKSDAQLVTDALAGDLGAIKHVDSFSAVNLDNTLTLIDMVNAEGSVWGRDKTALIKLWNNVGVDFLKVAGRNGGARWKLSVEKVSALWDDVTEAKALRDRFPKDVEAIVSQTLQANRDLVLTQMKQLGIPLDPNAAPAPLSDQQKDVVRDLQAAAAIVGRLQKAQEHARKVDVGWEMQDLSGGAGPSLSAGPEGLGNEPQGSGLSGIIYIPVAFDPLRPPQFKDMPEEKLPLVVVVKGNVAPYEEVAKKYSEATGWIQYFLRLYPELYAITREGKSEQTGDFAGKATPEQAREQLGKGMHKLFADIELTEKNLGNKLNVLDLTPVHARMTQQGVKAPGSPIAWNEPVAALAARDLVADHNFDEALKALAFETAAQALFLIAPFAGAGAIFVMLAGAAVLGAKAHLSAEKAEALTKAAGTAATPGTELVSEQAVDAAQREKEADQVALTLALVMVTAEAAMGAMAAIRGPKVEGAPATPSRVGVESQGAGVSTGKTFTDPFSGVTYEVVGEAGTARSLVTTTRADLGEMQAYKTAVGRGEIGLQRPGGPNLPGPDFITAIVDPNTTTAEIVVTDVKTSVKGNFPRPASSMPASWQAEVMDAVGPGRLQLGDPAIEEAVRDAAQKGRIRFRQLNVDYSAAGQGSVSGF